MRLRGRLGNSGPYQFTRRETSRGELTKSEEGEGGKGRVLHVDGIESDGVEGEFKTQRLWQTGEMGSVWDLTLRDCRFLYVATIGGRRKNVRCSWESRRAPSQKQRSIHGKIKSSSEETTKTMGNQLLAQHWVSNSCQRMCFTVHNGWGPSGSFTNPVIFHALTY